MPSLQRSFIRRYFQHSNNFFSVAFQILTFKQCIDIICIQLKKIPIALGRLELLCTIVHSKREGVTKYLQHCQKIEFQRIIIDAKDITLLLFPREGNSNYKTISKFPFKRPSFNERNFSINQENVLRSNCSPSRSTLLQVSSKARYLRVSNSLNLKPECVYL